MSVTLFDWDLDALPVDEGASWLSIDERNRAARFRFAQDRRRFIAGRTALRKTLGEALGIAPERVELVYNAHGKPALKDTRLHFNLSHSGGRALLALSETAALGVDIEEIRPELATEEVAQAVFTDAERAELTRNDFVETFFTLWTRKEAYLKAIGEGFASPSLVILDDWRIEPLCVGPGFKAALALQPGDNSRVQVC